MGIGWSVNDLASITETLTKELHAAVKSSPRYVAAPFHFEVSGQMPAVSRTDGADNVMSFYLLHVSRDAYWRNTPVSGQRGQPNIQQPLSLNLSYLLTSYAKHWHMEQYLMSVALSYFHAHPIYKTGTEEFSITVEADSIEEMSRLWQAITVPIRLSAMFRVAVVFLEAAKDPDPPMRTPVEVTVTVGTDLNTQPPVVPEPLLFEVMYEAAFSVDPDATVPEDIAKLPGDPVVVAGQSVRVRGLALDTADALTVFLGIPETPTQWPLDPTTRIFGTTASGTVGDADELLVRLPVAYAATPANGIVLSGTPLPGQYELRVGNLGSLFRSNALPLTIAPSMDDINAIAPLPPVLKPDGIGTYTVPVSGLIAGETDVLLNDVALAAGSYTVDAVAGSIALTLPSPAAFPPCTNVRVRVVVNGIEAPPGWWIETPCP
jgi:Pvc16 N-terminal domain